MNKIWYECKLCGKLFRFKYLIMQHMEEHIHSFISTLDFDLTQLNNNGGKHGKDK